MRDHARPLTPRNQLRKLTDSALLVALLCLGAFVIGPAEARALDRDVVFKFVPPPGPLTGYRLYVLNRSDRTRFEETAYTLNFQIPPDRDGLSRFVLTLDADIEYQAQLTAFNEQGESERSNAILLPAETCDPTLCDDGNPCTVDSCEAGACFNDSLPDGATCDDGFVDTVDDLCVASECQGTVLACGRDSDCDDGNPCNGAEFCDRGRVCLSGNAMRCPDMDPCMVGSCDPLRGCQQDPVRDGTSCDDGQAATVGDACFSGQCQGTQVQAKTGLHVSSLSPRRLRPGWQTLRIHGGGFAGKTKIQLVNGNGKPPKLKNLRVVDANTLEVDVYVSRKNRDSLWDLLVLVKKVGQITLPDSVMVSQ